MLSLKREWILSTSHCSKKFLISLPQNFQPARIPQRRPLPKQSYAYQILFRKRQPAGQFHCNSRCQGFFFEQRTNAEVRWSGSQIVFWLSPSLIFEVRNVVEKLFAAAIKSAHVSSAGATNEFTPSATAMPLSVCAATSTFGPTPPV